MQPLQKGGTVYILTNKTHTVLYTGVTSNLIVRMQQHQSKYFANSFTSKYNVTKLVYYRHFETIDEAIKEEKRIKAGNRQHKINLINTMNNEWNDLWLLDVSKW